MSTLSTQADIDAFPRELRKLGAVNSLNLREVLGSQATWILGLANGEVEPQPPAKEVVDPQTGRKTFIQIPVPQKAKGTCIRLKMLAGRESKEKWTYAWEIPDDEFPPRGRPREAFLQLLGKDVTVIARLEETAVEGVPFSRVIEIPQEWASFVVPAVEYLGSHPSVFNVKGTDKTDPELANLLSNSNPFLRLTAAQTLSEAHRLAWSDLKDPITTSEGLAQAALFHVALKGLPPQEETAMFTALQKFIQDSADSSRLKGLALAARAGRTGNPDDYFQIRSNRILRALDEKTPNPAVTADDRFIESILDNTGFRKTK